MAQSRWLPGHAVEAARRSPLRAARVGRGVRRRAAAAWGGAVFGLRLGGRPVELGAGGAAGFDSRPGEAATSMRFGFGVKASVCEAEPGQIQ